MLWMRMLDHEVVVKVGVEGLKGTCKGGLGRAQGATSCTMAASCSPDLPFLQPGVAPAVRMKMYLRAPAKTEPSGAQ